MTATVHIAPALIGDSTSANLTPVGAGASAPLGSAPSAADAAWSGCLNDLERMVVALFHENARLRRCAQSYTSSDPVHVHGEERVATPLLAASAVSVTRTSTHTPSHYASTADHDDLESNASFVFLTEHEGRGSPLLATDTDRDAAATDADADADAAVRNHDHDDDDDDVAPEVDALREENQLLKSQLRVAQDQLAALATASRRLREIIARAVSRGVKLDAVEPSPRDAAAKASSDLDATESALMTLVDERDQLKRESAHSQEAIQVLHDQIRVLDQQQQAPPVAAVASGSGSQDDVRSASETSTTTPLSPRRSLLNRFHVEFPQDSALTDEFTGASTPKSPRRQGSAASGTKTPPSYTAASTSRSATPQSLSGSDLLRFLLPESRSHTPTTASPGASPAMATLARGGPPGTPPSRPFTPPAALPSSLLF
ncbi:hypothetical protein AMAG_05520 [Allomyces macrogynus ATCC 38327]|uniref:Uncharacterized protein n=1 Tax=Allomyces macrogynus (strain ATCC 38327) TaxID=578462 RepID=A0A0L0SCE5_ALLM3|nr:hypothetical protein AMAG_05520 [Allomyces macrogynus ATCC 38327]|eukprot:KNE60094.1 hypothetical protein AMAG_05520 [Allomyces macrogynus ATCC 38327]